MIDPDTKIVTLSEAAEQRSKWSDRAVVTNGCFDILHAGHCRYLHTARAQGAHLIVLLNADKSVRRLKGPKRPLIPFEERAYVLASLACVDLVVGFYGLWCVDELKLLKPDLYVKGLPFPTESKELDAMRAMGVSIIFLGGVQGLSTTSIVDRVIERYGNIDPY